MTRDIQDKIRSLYPAQEAEAIIANWSFYSEMRFSRASWAGIKREAAMVLKLSKDSPSSHPDFVPVRNG